ncbi:partial heptose III glucuronosyltransferase, partial [Methylococcales bacterium]
MKPLALPVVAIIMPAFNAEKYLSESVQSVLSQTVDQWELLIVDDGSQDSTREIAQCYATSYPGKIRCVIHPASKNHGQFACRILGAKKATSDLIALLDADDIWDPNYLESHLRIWNDLKDQKIALSYGPVLFWHPNDKTGMTDFIQRMPSDSPKVFEPGELLEEFPLSGYAVTPCPSSTLIERPIFFQIERWKNIAKYCLAYEDQILWWFIASYYRVATHDKVLVRYRKQ